MATTAEPQPGNVQQAANKPTTRQGLGHRRPRPAAEADGVRTPRAPARRCRDQDHLRRHLPQRPPHLPQRLGRHAAIRSSPAMRSSAPSPRSATKSPATGRRHGRGRLHGRQLHGVRPVPGRLGSLLPQGLRPDLQQRRLSRRHDHQGRLHRPYRRPRSFRAARCRTAWTSAASRRCCAPGSPLTRRSASIMSGPGTKVGGRRSGRPRPYGRQARRGDGRACHHDHDHARARARMRGRWARTT